MRLYDAEEMNAEERKRALDSLSAEDFFEGRKQIAKLRAYLREKPELHYLFFELTDKCNLRCQHCGSGCEAHNARFLDAHAVISVIRSVAAREPRAHICLTGGEPLLHPEFDRIAHALCETRLYWSVVTNATLIDETIARKLSDCGVYSVSVSLDGGEAEHDLLRGSAGAFLLALRGVRMLRRYHIPVQITTVVTKRTLDRLDEIREIVRKADACSWKVVNIEPIGRALDHPELLLDRGDFLRLMDDIRSLRERETACGSELEVTYGCSHLLPLLYEETVRESPFLCAAGLQIASVQCSGDLAGCLDIERRPELVQGNIHQDDFWDVWDNRFAIFRADRTADSDTCSSCRLRDACGGDSLHTWDFEQRRPRMCMMQPF